MVKKKVELWSNVDIANKADWEGGILDVLGWVSSENVKDKELKKLWVKLEKSYSKLSPILDKIQRILDDAMLNDDIDEDIEE